jgi:hypothetical protein
MKQRDARNATNSEASIVIGNRLFSESETIEEQIRSGIAGPATKGGLHRSGDRPPVVNDSAGQSGSKSGSECRAATTE